MPAAGGVCRPAWTVPVTTEVGVGFMLDPPFTGPPVQEPSSVARFLAGVLRHGSETPGLRSRTTSPAKRSAKGPGSGGEDPVIGPK